MKNPRSGFTLIELLVVISIVSLLSSVVLSALNTARAKARDAQRIQSLGQIQKALILYYDSNGRYPIYTDMYGVLSTNNARWNALASDLSPYISTLPRDPVNNRSSLVFSDGYAYVYRSTSTGNAYDLIAFFETNNPLRCATNNWYSDAGVADFFGPPNYWCTAAGLPYLWINNRDYIYDVTR